MSKLFAEKRTFDKTTPITWDIVRHIYITEISGKIVIVAHGAAGIIGTCRKQWNCLMRQVMRERSSTLKAARIRELSRKITWMQKLSFSQKIEDGTPSGDITFIDIENLVKEPPVCEAMYILPDLSEDEISALTTRMPSHGLIVIYAKSLIEY